MSHRKSLSVLKCQLLYTVDPYEKQNLHAKTKLAAIFVLTSHYVENFLHKTCCKFCEAGLKCPFPQNLQQVLFASGFEQNVQGSTKFQDPRDTTIHNHRVDIDTNKGRLNSTSSTPLTGSRLPLLHLHCFIKMRAVQSTAKDDLATQAF